MAMELSEAAKAARRAYSKKWRDANKERIREHTRVYWEKRGQQALEAAERDSQDKDE